MKYIHTFELPTGTYYISRGPFENDIPIGKFKCWVNGCGIGPDFNKMSQAELWLSDYMKDDLKRRKMDLQENIIMIEDVLEVIDDVVDKSWIYNFKVKK